MVQLDAFCGSDEIIRLVELGCLLEKSIRNMNRIHKGVTATHLKIVDYLIDNVFSIDPGISEKIGCAVTIVLLILVEEGKKRRTDEQIFLTENLSTNYAYRQLNELFNLCLPKTQNLKTLYTHYMKTVAAMWNWSNIKSAQLRREAAILHRQAAVIMMGNNTCRREFDAHYHTSRYFREYLHFRLDCLALGLACVDDCATCADKSYPLSSLRVVTGLGRHSLDVPRLLLDSQDVLLSRGYTHASLDCEQNGKYFCIEDQNRGMVIVWHV